MTVTSGWSIITCVAERVPDRLARLVYLDAFVPRDGESLADLLPPEAVAWMDDRARTMGNGWRVPPPDADRRTAFPLAALRQPVVVSNPQAARLPRSYLACVETWAVPMFAHRRHAAARARAEGWEYRELAMGHLPMQTMPEQLAGLLVELASGRAGFADLGAHTARPDGTGEE